MRVLIPPPLHTYTLGVSVTDGAGATLAEVLAHLDVRYPGLRFRVVDEHDRIRPHIKMFINTRMAEGLSQPVGPADDVQIICALSGG